ncbi:MAG TPA: D-alanyl-D-alanine carboxypeptidase family protein [Gaiellaceae bacterium]|nr:D-alanyl-D-alanine carboxypeptidase family protein [Gaiellaceae bacterium]
MRRAVLLLALALAAAGASVAAASAAPPPVQAEAWLVQNATTGEVLASHDERERRPIASITKLMTALVALRHGDLDDVVVVPPHAARIGEATLDLRAGERVPLRDLLVAALVQSANDAANAVAAHVGGGSVARFVALMNAEARRLGLEDTHFVNPHGLDAPGHVSSARDVTKLARVAMRERFVRETVRVVHGSAAGRPIATWNDLLTQLPRTIGVKTGHTNGAGWSQVAAIRGQGVTIYATLLGGRTREGRNGDLAALLRWGLAQYRTSWTIGERTVYATVATAYDRPRVRLVAGKPALRVVRIGRPLTERVVAPVEVALPVRKGQRLGRVEVLDRGEVIAASPLVAAEAVDRPGRLERVRFYAGRTLHHLGGLFS